MGYLQDQIAEQVQQIRDHAHKWDLPEKHEALRIVPFVGKRCLVPCGPGRCNCYPTVGHHFCIVFEHRLKSCSEDFLMEMASLQSCVDHACPDNPPSSQMDEVDELSINHILDEINECHTALILSK